MFEAKSVEKKVCTFSLGLSLLRRYYINANDDGMRYWVMMHGGFGGFTGVTSRRR